LAVTTIRSFSWWRNRSHVLLELAHAREAVLKRHHEQEREQHLHPRQRHPELAQQLAQVAIHALPVGLLAAALGVLLHRRRG
jgi:hypothetical protein